MGAGAVSGHKNSQTENSAGAASTSLSSSPHRSNARVQSVSQSAGHDSDSSSAPGVRPQAGLASEATLKPSSTKNSMKMACELCGVSFTFFKRKKCCVECQRYFCSSCLPKPPASAPPGRQCGKCRQLVSGRFTRSDLHGWKVKDMRCFLQVKNISMAGCKEKRDLIELVLSHFCTLPGSRGGLDQSEHDDLVRQMAAHMRNVSIAGEEDGSGSGSPSRHPQPPPTTTSSPPPEATTSATTTSAAAAFASSFSSSASTRPPGANTTAFSSATTTTTRASGTAAETDGGGGDGGNGEEDDDEEELRARLRGIDDDRIRDLLDTMERLQQSFANMEDGENAAPSAPTNGIRRAQLDDIASMEDVEGLSVRQLKELLVNNFVDYRGCCERAELVQKVKTLWVDHHENVAIAQEIQKEEEFEAVGLTSGGTSSTTASKGQETPASAAGTSSNTTPSAAGGDGSDNNISSSIPSQSTTKKTKTDTKEEEEEQETLSPPSLPTAASETPLEKNPHHSPSPTATAPVSVPAANEKSSTGAANATAPAASGSSNNDLSESLLSSPSKRGRNQQDSLCHICMDSLVDCILLECGHMVTCTQCGKRLADCPICRQYISRVVRVFRS